MCDVCRERAAAGSLSSAVGAAGPDSPDQVNRAAQTEPGAVAPWEQLAPGRYMPRRTRGSFPGRELG